MKVLNIILLSLQVRRNYQMVLKSRWFVPTGMSGLPQNIVHKFQLKFPENYCSKHEQKFQDLWLNQYCRVPPEFWTIENSRQNVALYQKQMKCSSCKVFLTLPLTKHVVSELQTWRCNEGDSLFHLLHLRLLSKLFVRL